MNQQAQYANQPGHPDYDQYTSLKGMVDKMHSQNGIDANNGDISHRATSALLRAYKDQSGQENASLDPKQGIDGVVLSQSNASNPNVGGQYAILYQGDPNNPTVRTLGVPTQQLTQSAEQNLQEVNRINDQQSLAQSRGLPSHEQRHTQQQAPQQQAPDMGSRSLF